ncbi:hypothetical protein BDW66DRAFT_152384 [Aspergillus desertorum]
MSATRIVKSHGPFQGLPTYPETPEFSNLSAGGDRCKWSIRLPYAPPSNFFTDLGDGASRVEHVPVDFLSETAEIAGRLRENILRVYAHGLQIVALTAYIVDRDYVLFFSYMQPQQDGNVLGMWSDAEALTKINTTLLNNFLGALQQTNLQPRRFLLQTGAKQCGFHIGPATNPSFETDPRVPLESNFYYPQEDALPSYCAATGVGWNVIRPSYIIGAVRDGALNNMIGLAIYASLGDREFCQSTALLNAYFEEWAVLTPDAENQAFNIQDGLPFTYGPTGVTRSTFSFQEWSGLSSVQTAWQELREKHELALDPFTPQYRTQIFGMTDSAIIGGWALSLSMRKARRMGFLGTVGSFESARIAIGDLARLKLVPPVQGAI